MAVFEYRFRLAGIWQSTASNHFLAVPLLPAPAAPSRVDNAGAAATTSFVIMHGH